MNSDFSRGFKAGIPIALGYFPVSFTFGLIAVNGGIPVWLTIFISFSNLTSAGQFAGTNLIIANVPFIEIALTTFVINIRYMLMSLSLSQKIKANMPMLHRCIIAFGITDETFAVASLEKKELTFSYMIGLIVGPFAGWVLGTATGAMVCSVLPEQVQSAMGIALYAMFIALVIPPSKKSKAALTVTSIGIVISSIFKWTPYINQISDGFRIIIATIVASTIGALLFPKGEEL
ncbi:MAG TPA: AzlC family ABC transporter permease [Defluviitaleaceae bacterium]|jgi:4-azaleucine resistance transporter AzlC|nr:AzlC family ABC transporter permease [Candidatus Epulonipiscium sp.]HOA81433.1 AzlC family ABC transporter permease [Defluviitaleaceae bacterium]